MSVQCVCQDMRMIFIRFPLRVAHGVYNVTAHQPLFIIILKILGLGIYIYLTAGVKHHVLLCCCCHHCLSTQHYFLLYDMI